MVRKSVQSLCVTLRLLSQVAAGNNAAKADDYSPATARGALTVGASNIGDTIFPASNFGSFLDIFAPGQDITTAGIPKTDVSYCTVPHCTLFT